MDRPHRSAFVAIAALLLALVAYTYSIRFRAIDEPPAPPLQLIPDTCGAYRGTDESFDGGALDLLGADATLFRTYRSPGEGPVLLFVGYFGSPQENSQIHSPKHCYPGAGWSILEEGMTPISLGGARRAVQRLVISDGVGRQLVLYWFSSADAVISNEFALKWRQMRDALLGGKRATAFVRFSTAIEAHEDPAGAERRLALFAETLAPGIEAVLHAGGGAPSAPATPVDSDTTGAAAR